MIGKVYLVGAGPGDPELLTVKALRILQQADLVLHDDLVPASILRLAGPGAEIVNVGKRCGKKSLSQGEINARIIASATQGLLVIRLKGGDPAIFSRAGEEIEALAEADVDYEIVPGVTAASAAAAAAGIALTHRDLASSVLFLTGHRAARKTPTGESARSAARADMAGPTRVIYMPGPDYRPIQQELRTAGIRDDTPCLLISSASTAAGRMHRTTLGQLTEVPRFPAPNILIVGDVVSSVRSGWQMKASDPASMLLSSQIPGWDDHSNTSM